MKSNLTMPELFLITLWCLIVISKYMPIIYIVPISIYLYLYNDIKVQHIVKQDLKIHY